MSVNISEFLMEGLSASNLEDSGGASIQSDTSYIAYLNTYAAYERSYSDYSNYSVYYDYYNYSAYYDYYNYSVYYNYYNYSNYSNSISILAHPISQSVTTNETVTFTVRASNNIDSCQWYIANSPTDSGTAIPGATSPTYSFRADMGVDGMYYYCIVRRGANSATTTRAILTVRSLTAYDIYLPVNVTDAAHMLFINANPPSTTITSISIADPTIVSATSDGYLTGLKIGRTTCTVTGSNNVTATFTITVIEDRYSAILTNIAIAIRYYRGVQCSIYPNQMANMIRNGSRTSKLYTSDTDLFTDIANAIREKNGKTNTMKPVDFYYAILELTTI